MSGVISGSGALSINGTGAVTLNGINTYSGGTTLASGILTIANGNGVGTGTLHLIGTAGSGLGSYGLTVATSSATTLANNIVLGSSGSVTIVKASSGQTTGTVLTLSGVISGGGSGSTLYLNSNTSGDTSTTYNITGNNTFSGTIQEYQGCVFIGNNNALGTHNALQMNANDSPSGDLPVRFRCHLLRQ